VTIPPDAANHRHLGATPRDSLRRHYEVAPGGRRRHTSPVPWRGPERSEARLSFGAATYRLDLKCRPRGIEQPGAHVRSVELPDFSERKVGCAARVCATNCSASSPRSGKTSSRVVGNQSPYSPVGAIHGVIPPGAAIPLQPRGRRQSTRSLTDPRSVGLRFGESSEDDLGLLRKDIPSQMRMRRGTEGDSELEQCAGLSRTSWRSSQRDRGTWPPSESSTPCAAGSTARTLDLPPGWSAHQRALEDSGARARGMVT